MGYHSATARWLGTLGGPRVWGLGVREVLQVCPLFIATSKLGMYCTAAWPVPLSSHWPSSLRQYTLARWRASAPLSPMLAHPALGPGARAAACCSAEPQRPRAKRALATAAKAHKRQTDVAPFPYPPRRSPLLLHASSQLICGRARRSTAFTFCYAMPAFRFRHAQRPRSLDHTTTEWNHRDSSKLTRR